MTTLKKRLLYLLADVNHCEMFWSWSHVIDVFFDKIVDISILYRCFFITKAAEGNMRKYDLYLDTSATLLNYFSRYELWSKYVWKLK